MPLTNRTRKKKFQSSKICFILYAPQQPPLCSRVKKQGWLIHHQKFNAGSVTLTLKYTILLDSRLWLRTDH